MTKWWKLQLLSYGILNNKGKFPTQVFLHRYSHYPIVCPHIQGSLILYNSARSSKLVLLTNILHLTEFNILIRKMATEAAKLMLQCINNGCLSLFDMDIERRPYHKNCSCALHKSEGPISTVCSRHRSVSFPEKPSGNYKSISMSAAASEFSSDFFT